MKMPKTDTGKTSLPGELAVVKNADSVSSHFCVVVGPTGYLLDKFISQTLHVYPKESAPSNSMITVYDHGPVPGVWATFDNVRSRLEREWDHTQIWKTFPVITPELSEKMRRIRTEQEAINLDDSA